MDKKILFLVVFLVAVTLIVQLTFAAKGGVSGRPGKPPKACRDEIDNDGDGYTDWPNDPGCDSKNDNSELNPDIECDDGIDNDGDNAIDYNDSGCNGPTDNDETDCGDGVCEGGETSETCPEDCEEPDSCSDTDYGFAPTVKGTVSGYSGGDPYSDTDYCLTNMTVREYYCSGTEPLYSDYNCYTNMTTSCVNGACV
jgi:hypothetical protein